ncbi:hypothetical protein AA103196_2899 [Ameyamaea chiangmaiensis NBRC 103196]|uniref:Glycosyltransferase family 39 protein n=1 Tax=Ameyamaea chiangmaiensis TaxID=442969 RepID=A0A850PBY0_9PROT|nr:glycosyltransferase family 39 protein [Ameyamaea chiangmaiensis]MBS4074386.1 glycosyltransferase family 39 protein [Ameyamaea chiangmaiensis]NVN41614.1 glycosyltransferase family 39 protein [Ameyamaea chiangmaiensis]GBQ71861.1 hypothetical protein AA103196_2899 [Ameyamaea chiangmaiensis NBRC 103196]
MDTARATTGRDEGPGLPVVVLCLVLTAVLARWRTFGNPLVSLDEQFYRLVGGRLLHGALPYVDIWDRKPLGLFVLFAAFRLPGGDGVWAYQIAALLSVCGTAILVFLMGRRVAPAAGALVSAVLYILWLDLAEGEGGQTPVYYTLLVTAAMAIVLFRHRDGLARQGTLRAPGMAVMALFGLAMQIKYTAIFEGIFAGLALLWFSRRQGRSIPALAVDAALWMTMAALPTAIAGACYAAIGHFDAWWFANAGSIAHRGHESPVTTHMRLAHMTKNVLPLLVCIPIRRIAACREPASDQTADLALLDLWSLVALLAVAVFGTWYGHYALPLFAPLALCAAPLWRWRWGRVVLLTLAVLGFVAGQRQLYKHQISFGRAINLDHAVAAVAGHRGCLFVYDGWPALYDVTSSCLPTDHPFPGHLNQQTERGAVGIDQTAEVRRIMATRPDRVMTAEPAYQEENRDARAALYSVLRSDYRVLYRYDNSWRQVVVYGLKTDTPDLPPRIDEPATRFFP